MREHYRNIVRAATPGYYILGDRPQRDKPWFLDCEVITLWNFVSFGRKGNTNTMNFLSSCDRGLS